MVLGAAKIFDCVIHRTNPVVRRMIVHRWSNDPGRSTNDSSSFVEKTQPFNERRAIFTRKSPRFAATCFMASFKGFFRLLPPVNILRTEDLALRQRCGVLCFCGFQSF